ncbi:MAG: FtsQ-type POTRA domain-containing protein [Actinomycetota bacterium]|nr:FtsQ-type POTRA domain-containing protein [Actinomycetota bacterium]
MRPDDPSTDAVRAFEAPPVVVPDATPSTGPVGHRGGEAPAHPVVQVDEARRRRLRPWAITGAALVVVVTGSVAASYTPLFAARVIEVEGERRLAPRRVMRLAHVGEGTNVLHLDTGAAEARLESDPWILDASVETRLPGTITISVRERKAVMVLVEGGGERRLVAVDGTDLGRAPRRVALPEVASASGDPLGPEGVASAGAVLQAMAPVVRARVASVAVSADGSIQVLLDGPVEVTYGLVVDAMAKGQALRAILDYADEQDRALLSVDLSAPAAPTARFVGSVQPMTVPDPSADATSASGDDAPAGSGTPSPSPSP